MAVDPAQLVPELCRAAGFQEATHHAGFGYLVKTEGDFKLALVRFQERYGRPPVTYNYKRPSLILSYHKAITFEGLLSEGEAYARRSRAVAPAEGPLQPAPASAGAGHPRSGPPSPDRGSPDHQAVAQNLPLASGLQGVPTPQPLSQLPGPNARCAVCGGDATTCWCGE